MNGDEKKKIDGKVSYPLGTKLTEEIAEFRTALFVMEECGIPTEQMQKKFDDMLNNMFLLLYHHRYGVLYNVLKKFR